MDFEGAAQRLERDQKKYRGRRDVALSQKAKKQAEYQKKLQAKMREERERKKRLEEYQKHYMHSCDRVLSSKPLSSLFQATSIHGEGDKITLPPSVLESLTSQEMNIGNPWTFRIGIPNPDYKFPTSVLIHTLKPPPEDDYMLVDDYDSEEEHERDGDDKAAYMDELSYKYLTYTHCTVVEFTQEEGHVGIPQPIASALLNPQNKNASMVVPTTRTVDPASKSVPDDNNTDIDATTDTQTPGHLAWGAFDIPDTPLEITLVKLPKGKGCTLVPTKQAVQNNFYGLQDVKLVLEQSLIRTRATLSVGGVVSTWHRGVKFDLDVTKVLPSSFQAVTCINTDIEVDIGAIQEDPRDQNTTSTSPQQQSKPEQGHKLGTGQKLSSSTATTAPSPALPPTSATSTISKILLPEPPEDQNDGVCVIQIRHSGGHGKRRFDLRKATVKDLFDFAASLIGDERNFQLVTRFPRRIFLVNEHEFTTLVDSGIQQGQEMFMVELL